MGKHNDRRGTRRRDFEDDGGTTGGNNEEPSYFQRSPAATAPPVEAEVLWFNADKGFGFVKATDGAEAFLHVRALEAAGRSSIGEGTRLVVRIEQGQKGKQVADVLEISAESSPGTAVKRPPGPFVMPSGSESAETESRGTVKWYDAKKGFGFIGPDDGGKDVFVHVSTLTRSGITALSEGQTVLVAYGQGKKGPEARSVTLVP